MPLFVWPWVDNEMVPGARLELLQSSDAFRRIGERVSVTAASLLQELRIFDVYQGKGVEIGRKSVALGLILQDLSRTLTDEEADRVVDAVRADLRSNLDARIRE